jgi:hypothetical protein
MELHLNIAGALLIVLSLLHIIFPMYFKWKVELSGLSHINREMMYVHTFFIALTVMLMGVLCLTSANEITGTLLGRKIAFGFGIFWIVRLVIQFFGYSSILWRGKKLETAVHVLFSILWTYFSFVFILTYLQL